MLTAGPPEPAGQGRTGIRVGLDAHTVGRRQTGNERYVVELAAALDRRPDVDLLAYVDRGAAWPGAAAPATAELRMRAPQLRIPWELPLRARRDRLDVLQVSYVAPPVAGLPVVTVVHDLSFEDHPEWYPRPTRLRLQWLTRLSVRRSAAIVAVSRFTSERLIDVYGLPPERVHSVPNGVGDEWLPTPAMESEAVARRLGVSAEYILAVGTSHPRKNLARLVEAVAAVRAQRGGTPDLVIAGPRDERADDVDRAVDAAAARRWVRRLGYVHDDELRALYSRAAAVAYVSLYEGFGLPVLEALGCGATVVASSTTAVAEAAGDACILVDPLDAASIAAGLGAALDDARLRSHLRSRVADHLARFSWDSCAAAMVDVYRAALGRRDR